MFLLGLYVRTSNPSTKLNALALFSVPLLPVDDVLSEREVFPTGDVSGQRDAPVGPERLRRRSSTGAVSDWPSEAGLGTAS